MPILAAFMVPHPPMIVPQVGRGSEKKISRTVKAYEETAAQIAALKPETIVVTSPHIVLYSDYFHIAPGLRAAGSFGGFGAPGVRFSEQYDAQFVQELCGIAENASFPAGILGEREKELDHGTMVPLFFIRNKYSGFRLVRIGLSGLPLADHYRLGEMIREAADRTNRRVVLVASGDLSHKLKDYGPYGYAEEGPQYDARIMDVCSRAAFGELFDFDENFCDRAAECGHRSFVIMAGAFDGRKVTAEQLSHEDVTGVGYGICTFYPGEEDASRRFLKQYLEKQEAELLAIRGKEDAYVRLARASVEKYVTKRRMLTLREYCAGEDAEALLPKELTDTCAGAFVSIHKHGKLRGCIGTILPTKDSLAQEILHNAVSACARDPRFDPVQPEELPWLEINVDVMGKPEPIDSPDALDVKRYGVIVTKGGRRGLLLPDLEGVDTVEQQISIAKQKAGIRPGEQVSLERFEVVRHR